MRQPDPVRPIDPQPPAASRVLLNAQTWESLALLHWPVPAERVQQLLPPGLVVDEHEGETWLGVVPFAMSGVRVPPLPAIPRCSAFPELNVRVYVHDLAGNRGVWFLGLWCSNAAFVAAARTLGLPYHRALAHTRTMPGSGPGLVSGADPVRAYRFLRSGGAAISFSATVRAGETVDASAGLAAWLTARWNMFAFRGGRLWRYPVHHEPWTLRRAVAEGLHTDAHRRFGFPLRRFLRSCTSPSPCTHWSDHRGSRRRPGAQGGSHRRGRGVNCGVDGRSVCDNPDPGGHWGVTCLMDTTASAPRRVLGRLLAGAGAGLALTAIGFVLGGATAQAAERPAGLLDDLSSVVESTTSTVTSTVTSTAADLVGDAIDGVVAPVIQLVAPAAPAVTEPVAETFTQVVDPVIEIVDSVPIVGPDTAATVSSAANTVVATSGAAADSATRLLGEAPTGQLTRPIIAALQGLPVAEALIGGLDPLLGAGIDGVDTVLALLGATVASATAPVTAIEVIPPGLPGPQPIEAIIPGEPGTPGARGGSPPAVEAQALAPPGQARFLSGVPPEPQASAASALIPDGSALNSATTPGQSGLAAVPPSSTAPSSSSAGSGGGSGGAAALVSDTAPMPLRAWERAAGAPDDALPPAPVFDTDISPD